jgi:hypothetical protein
MNLCSSLNVTDCVSHPYKNNWQIMGLSLVKFQFNFTVCSLQYIEVGSKLQYCIIGSFCSQAFIGAKWGWCYVGVCVHFNFLNRRWQRGQ